MDGSKHNASTRAQKPSAGGMGNIIFDAVACEVSQQASNLELKHKWGGELTVLLEGCTVKNISNYGASCNRGDFVRVKGCVFDNCRTHAIYIKDQTNFCVSNAAFIHHQNVAVVQAVNYSGVVNLNNIVCFKTELILWMR